MPVTETQFREAYVYAERTLGRNPVIRPDFTFRQTLETKLRLQMECFRGMWSEECGVRYAEVLADDLYERTVDQTSKSRKVLQTLKDQGVPMVLVSNFYGNMHTVLHEFGFDGLFHKVIESAVVGIRKPDPRIFLLGVEALGLKPEEVTVVGDSLDKDIMPAHEAGCQTIWLRGEGWTSASHNGDCPYCETINALDEILEMIKTKKTI